MKAEAVCGHDGRNEGFSGWHEAGDLCRFGACKNLMENQQW